MCHSAKSETLQCILLPSPAQITHTCKTTPKRSTSPSCCQYRMETEDSLGKRKAASKTRTLKNSRYLGNRQGLSAEVRKRKGNEGGGGVAARLSLNSCSLTLLGQNPEQVHHLTWLRKFLTVIFFPIFLRIGNIEKRIQTSFSDISV